MPNTSSLSGSTSSSSSPSDDNRNFNVGLLVPIIGTAVLLLLGGLCCCWMHRQWEKSGRRGERPSAHGGRRAVAISFSQLGRPSDMSDVVTPSSIQTVCMYHVTGEDTAHFRRVPHRDAYELGSDSGPNYARRSLQEDRNVTRKRIPFKELKLRARLATSQTREVRLGEYQNRQVVVKRLLKSKRSHVFHLQEFIYQLQLRVTISHPNIVTLVGVAWSSVADVMLVTEHYPLGDLLSYLSHYGDQPTPVAHRDLRASNVLLTEAMRAKLSGFDSSCLDEHSHRCHVAGPPPFWSAPEVLRGRPYTAKADMYAFGVLLTELDAARPPVYDAVSPVGTRLKPIQVLNEVMQGTLRPSFRADCPRRIRVISVGCYQQDARRRPTADQLLRRLEA
ncbi:TKL/DRK protein kinase [Phytophthora cinnamomi]|uniref:TKL/DRK protein kinase n=1 Tax=Phytophthora cinnamomi TaxID=4785 RepID=UPI003559EDC1|nr:TKL/DRK protein kinase [Phytophthora cinnamomi]